MAKSYELCPKCGTDTDDMTDSGICYECLCDNNMSRDQKKRRNFSSAMDLFESGHDVDLSSF